MPRGLFICMNHKRIMARNIGKLQIGKYYHKKMKTCDMKSVSEMKEAQANKLISSERASIISRRQYHTNIPSLRHRIITTDES